MEESKILKAIGWLLILFGVLIIVAANVAGIDLTEGQLFVEYLPWWVLAIASLLGGVAIINNSKAR